MLSSTKDLRPGSVGRRPGEEVPPFASPSPGPPPPASPGKDRLARQLPRVRCASSGCRPGQTGRPDQVPTQSLVLFLSALAFSRFRGGV